MMLGRFLGAAVLAASLAFASPASAHCDGLDGPVVAAARQALEHNDLNRVLIWVLPGDEAEIRAAFDHAIRVRRLGPEARELADRYFFETLVRVHRAGEGAPYTGLKPAGHDVSAAIRLADSAVASGTDGEVTRFITQQVADGIRDRFQDLLSKRSFDPEDVAAGRAYVASYVSFIHYVGALDAAARQAAEGHHAEGEASRTAVLGQGHAGH